MANTNFGTLKENGLKLADHKTTDAFAKDKMGIFVNQTIQEILALEQGRRFAEDYDTISTVADQEYVELSSITGTKNAGMTCDEISSVYQTEDDVWLNRISIQQYRQMFSDVSNNEGNPLCFARWADRLYLYPRPDAIITLYIDFWVNQTILTSDSTASIIPPKYDEWILAGSVWRWKKTYEPEDVNQVTIFKQIYDDLTSRFGDDLSREPSRRPIASSHGKTIGRRAWKTPS